MRSSSCIFILTKGSHSWIHNPSAPIQDVNEGKIDSDGGHKIRQHLIQKVFFHDDPMGLRLAKMLRLPVQIRKTDLKPNAVKPLTEMVEVQFP